MRCFLIASILITFYCNKISSTNDICTIDIQKLSLNQPLFLKSESNEFFFPNEYRKITLNFGEKIQLYCENAFRSDKNHQNLILTCGKDKIENFLECNEQNIETARNMNKNCPNIRSNAYLLEIGFKVADNFTTLMQICYNATNENAIYSMNELGPHSGWFQTQVPRPYFKPGNFHPYLNVSRLYSRFIQRKTFEQLLGQRVTNQYMNNNTLARGHLAAMADFIYAPHQLATFYYVNVAPQWDSFNSGNWVNLENSLRRFASKSKLNLDVYTGTYGVSDLLSDSNMQKDLYLYAERNQKKLPIPKLYYKIIVDKSTARGIVIIGVNNPHITEKEVEKNYVICKDIKDSVKWINLKSNVEEGYMYACTVKDFINTVNYMKFIKVKGVLTE